MSALPPPSPGGDLGMGSSIQSSGGLHIPGYIPAYANSQLELARDELGPFPMSQNSLYDEGIVRYFSVVV